MRQEKAAKQHTSRRRTNVATSSTAAGEDTKSTEALTTPIEEKSVRPSPPVGSNDSGLPAWLQRITSHDHAALWALIAVLGTVSILLWMSTFGMEPPSTALTVPWVLAIVGFFLVESFVVNLHFRSESGSFSLLEVPLVFGLLFISPALLWVSIIIGAALSLRFVRKQPVLKLAFNLANLSLHVAVAALLFNWFLGPAEPLSIHGWVAMLGATAVSAVIEITAINAVIGLAEGDFVPRRAWNVTAFGTLVSTANSVQALIAALIMVIEPWGGVLLLASISVLFAAYRAYLSERDHRERVEFLYNSTRALRDSNESAEAVTALLEEATSMFRAGTAELVLFSVVDSDEPAVRFLITDGFNERHTIGPAQEAEVRELAELTVHARLISDRAAPAPILAYLQRQGLPDAMVGTLRTDHRMVGYFIVGDRLGNVTSFSHEDLRLFENLVEQAAVALENDQLEQTLARLRELEMELAYQARYDTLTGLANRSLFAARVDEHLGAHKDADVHVLYIDLDDFKLVNDTLGHSFGDMLLAEVADRIRAAVRPSDLAARLGGDEFAVMLVSSPDSRPIAHRIIESLSAPFFIGANEVRIGASVGIASRSASEQATALELLHKADLAMYSAKERGKGSIASFTERLEHDVVRQQTLQTDLRRAISEEEFEVLYQPIVRLEDLTIVGAEALVRWRQNGGELLSPAHFIAEAERTGLITSIDRQVRTKVLGDVGALVEAADGAFFASINLSARHLHHREVVDDLAGAILSFGAAPESLVLEVTETAFARDHELAAEVLHDIRSLGVRIALDDFGTGYSSLSYLRDLPIDLLKIAQPFINDLVDTADPTFVEAITNLSHTLGLTVVAEGIETDPALRELQAMSCDLGQGFHFSRPIPLDSLTVMLATQSAGHSPLGAQLDLTSLRK